jgi:LDH2 family malate/lactate/ureidoglycolate dehydrogenase
LAVTSEDRILVPVDRIRHLSEQLFERLGLSTDDAHVVVDVLVDANLRGISSHGFQRVPIYATRLHAGLAGGSEHMSIVAEFGALCHMNAGNGLGPAVAVKALDHAISLARQFGVGLVTVGGSTHFGPAGYYARRASSKGFVGVVVTNAPKTMAPYGASERFIGTNPLAVAIPLERHDDFVLDIATSVVARGKIIQAAQVGELIPLGLAIDSQGRPTTDARAALDGSVLPFAGPKGSGLSIAIDMLSGVLAHADFDDELGSMYEDFDRPQNVGHLFLVIDPWRLSGRDDGLSRWDALIDRLGHLRPSEGATSVLYPGQPEAALARDRVLHGAPIERKELAAFADLCVEYGFGDLAEAAVSLMEPLERAGPPQG